MSWNRPKSGVSAAEPARGRRRWNIEGGLRAAVGEFRMGASTSLYTLAPGAEKWYHIAILSVVL